MGGTSSSEQTQLQQQTTTPWAAAEGPLKNILSQLQGINPNLTGTESGALDWLTANGGNQFAGSISDVARQMLNGGGPDRTGMLTDATPDTKRQWTLLRVNQLGLDAEGMMNG